MTPEKKFITILFAKLSFKIKEDFDKYGDFEIDVDSLEVHQDETIKNNKPGYLGAYCFVNCKSLNIRYTNIAAQHEIKSKQNGLYLYKIQSELSRMIKLFFNELEKERSIDNENV